MNRQSAAAVIDAARFNRTHWLILGWGCFIMLFDGYDMVIYGSVVPRLMQEWQLSPVQAGTLGSCALFGMLFGGTLLAPLADRFGRRRLVIATTLLASLAAFLTGHARDPLELGAGRFFTGLALGALVPSAINLISEFAPAGRRSTLVTVMSAFYSVGAVLSALLAIAMIPAWGWQSVFYVAVLPVLAVPLMLRWLPESAAFLELKGRRAELDALLRKVDPDYRPGAERANAVAAEAPSGRVAQLFEGRQAVGTLLLWVAFAMCMLMSYGLNTWLPKLMAGGGYALGSSLAFLVTLNVGATLGALFGGWLADRLGAGRTLVLFFAPGRGLPGGPRPGARPLAAQRPAGGGRRHHHRHPGGDPCLRRAVLSGLGALHRGRLGRRRRPPRRHRRADARRQPAGPGAAVPAELPGLRRARRDRRAGDRLHPPAAARAGGSVRRRDGEETPVIFERGEER